MKINWRFIGSYASICEVELYFENGRPKTVKKSNNTNCTPCSANNHKMKMQYMDCARTDCLENKCETRYRILSKFFFKILVFSAFVFCFQSPFKFRFDSVVVLRSFELYEFRFGFWYVIGCFNS
jgi:hypothetical protein